MTKNTKNITAETAAAAEQAKIAAIEAQLVVKYGDRIVKGSVRRATDPRYGAKMMVTINTVGLDGLPDGKTREIATSDVFQVKHQPEVATELRKLRAKEKRAAARALKKAEGKKNKAQDIEAQAEALGV